MELPLRNDEFLLKSGRLFCYPRYVNRGKVLVGGGPGSWDHTQYSESKVEYRAGVFHLFFSAGSTPPGDTQNGPGRRRLGDAWETTGYAFSFVSMKPII